MMNMELLSIILSAIAILNQNKLDEGKVILKLAIKEIEKIQSSASTARDKDGV